MSFKAQGRPPKQRIVQFKMSVVPWLINAGPSPGQPSVLKGFDPGCYTLFSPKNYLLLIVTGHPGFSRSKSVCVPVYSVIFLIV